MVKDQILAKHQGVVALPCERESSLICRCPHERLELNSTDVSQHVPLTLSPTDPLRHSCVYVTTRIDVVTGVRSDEVCTERRSSRGQKCSIEQIKIILEFLKFSGSSVAVEVFLVRRNVVQACCEYERLFFNFRHGQTAEKRERERKRERETT